MDNKIRGAEAATELVTVSLYSLHGPALRWAVAQIEGLSVSLASPHYDTGWRVFLSSSGYAYRPDVDWTQGGPLLDKYAGTFGMTRGRLPHDEFRCFAVKPGPERFMRIAGGDTVLIALCRAVVRLHRGDEVSVPRVLAHAA